MVGRSKSSELRPAMSAVLCWGIICGINNMVQNLSPSIQLRANFIYFGANGCWIDLYAVLTNLLLLEEIKMHLIHAYYLWSLIHGDQPDGGSVTWTLKKCEKSASEE